MDDAAVLRLFPLVKLNILKWLRGREVSVSRVKAKSLQWFKS